MSKEQRQSLKLLEPISFNMYKNTAIPMIVMLSHLELDTEVLDVGLKTTESNNYKEVSRDNSNANSILITT